MNDPNKYLKSEHSNNQSHHSLFKSKSKSKSIKDSSDDSDIENNNESLMESSIDQDVISTIKSCSLTDEEDHDCDYNCQKSMNINSNHICQNDRDSENDDHSVSSQNKNNSRNSYESENKSRICLTSKSKSNYESNYESDNEVIIPKLIMQTWKDRNIPKKWKSSKESIKKHMKGWRYILMTDEDNLKFVGKYFPDFLPYYNKFEYNIQRVDAVRYMWLYIYGGIYMDLDFEVLKPMDDLFTKKDNSKVYLVSSGNIGVYITNSFMASKPRCKLWLDVIERMKKPLPWYYLGKHARVMNTTGPIMLTHVVTHSDYPYVRLPKSKINPCSVCDINKHVKGTYLRPLEGSSWASYDTAVYNYFMCNWKPLSTVLIILIVFIFLWIIIKLFITYFYKN